MRIDGQAAPMDVLPAAPTNPGLKVEGNQYQNGVQDAKAREVEQKPVSEDVREAVQYSNDVMKLANYHLKFEWQEESQKCQVKVVDTDTGDIIREIPPDFMMKIAKQLQGKIEAEVGLLLDQTA